MELFEVKVTTSNVEQMNKLFKYLLDWNLPPEDILHIGKGKATESKKTIFHFYVLPKNVEILQAEKFPVEIVLDLSKIPDPRSYVSKTNRFKDELERIKKKRKS